MSLTPNRSVDSDTFTLGIGQLLRLLMPNHQRRYNKGEGNGKMHSTSSRSPFRSRRSKLSCMWFPLRWLSWQLRLRWRLQFILPVGRQQ